MKKVWNAVYCLLPHLTLASALMLLTFVIVDHFNRAMSFLDNHMTKTVLLVFLILVLVQSAATIALHDKMEKNEEKDRSEREERKSD